MSNDITKYVRCSCPECGHNQTIKVKMLYVVGSRSCQHIMHIGICPKCGYDFNRR